MPGDSEGRARQVEQLRRQHPDWWVWYSNNYGFRGFYATPKDESRQQVKLRADTAEELTEQIYAR